LKLLNFLEHNLSTGTKNSCLVFSSVGFENQEQVVNAGTTKVDVSLKQAFTLGTEVVVAASRVAERILESPVTIERISNSTIKNAPVSNYYDLLNILPNVKCVTEFGISFLFN
jgi:hypothetical protein